MQLLRLSNFFAIVAAAALLTYGTAAAPSPSLTAAGNATTDLDTRQYCAFVEGSSTVTLTSDANSYWPGDENVQLTIELYSIGGPVEWCLYLLTTGQCQVYNQPGAMGWPMACSNFEIQTFTLTIPSDVPGGHYLFWGQTTNFDGASEVSFISGDVYIGW